jgi:hypothetical protein
MIAGMLGALLVLAILIAILKVLWWFFSDPDNYR